MSTIANKMASIALASAMITGFSGCAGRESMDEHLNTEQTGSTAQTETVDVQQTELIEKDEQSPENDSDIDEETVSPDTPNAAPEAVVWDGELTEYGDITAAAPAEDAAWQMFEDETNEYHVTFVDTSSDEWTGGDYWDSPMAQFSINRDYKTAWELMDSIQWLADENEEHYQIEEMDLGQYHFLFYNPQIGQPQLITEMKDGNLLVINPSRNLDLEDPEFLKIIASILQ